MTEERLTEAEFPFNVVTANDDELIILFAKLQTSPLLADHYFVERELHVFIARRSGKVVAVLDTSRAGLDRNASETLGRPLVRNRLVRLLSRSPNTRLVEVNARSAAVGPSSVRRRSTSAASLEATPPALDEFQFVASSITAMDRNFRRSDPDNDPDEDQFSMRSVGFGRGRITDASARTTLEGWTAWTDRLIGAASDSSRKGPRYLDRFAQPLDRPPPRPWPLNVLLDLDEAQQLFILNVVSEEHEEGSLDIEDVCIDCARVPGRPSAPRAVELIANGKICNGTFEYLVPDERYKLVCPDLERRYRYEDGAHTGNLVDYLNTNQSFVVVPESENAIYSEGGFYDPQLKLGVNFDPDALGLSDLIVDHPGLRNCRSEKGGNGSATAQRWADGSVFNWIDRHLDELLPGADLVLCDDGRRECCDFLLVGRRSGREVVIMVHAKASKTQSFVAASALHDVCSQAAKQVGTLALFGPQQPSQIGLWDGSWDGPGGEGQVKSRIRRARGRWSRLTGAEIWQRLSLLIENQSTDREVALVLGASLVRKRLFAQARQPLWQLSPASMRGCEFSAVSEEHPRYRGFYWN